jgi:two-component system, OmpR family, response regulator
MQQRVLIVDDDTELSAMMCEYLARENFAVETSDDGFSGARRALSGDFDIAVLDVAMPTRSGLDTLRETVIGERVVARYPETAVVA